MSRLLYLKLSALSVFVCLSLIPLGGYGGHHLKFLAASIIYFGLTFFCLNKTNFRKEILYVILVLALPPLILYLPIHIENFTATQISLISTIGHFFGIAFGVLAHFMNTKVRIALVAMLLAVSLWVTFVGYPFWLHKLNYGTFTSKVNYDLPASITGQNQYGDRLTDNSFKNKIVLLDFWHTRCGVCFQKFPLLQEMYETYRMDTSVVILAINKPLSQDTTGQAFAVLKEKGYSFPILLPAVDTLPELFEVFSYPTTFIIDKSGKVIFKGDIENAKSVIAQTVKNGM